MGVCASTDSGEAPFTLWLGREADAAAAASPENVAFVAVSRWRQKQLAAAFHTWWELWVAQRQSVPSGSIYTYTQRRRLKRAFHIWARDQLSQKLAWERFQEGDANLPPLPLAVEGGERQRGGWQAVGTAQESFTPTPSWMESWDEAKSRIAAIRQQNRVAAARRRRLERATSQRAWASTEAALVHGTGASPEIGASHALQWVQSLLPQGGDALAGEWRAVGQYTDASNFRVRVSERFMIVDGADGQRHGYPLPPTPGQDRDSSSSWIGRSTSSGCENREYLLRDFVVDETGVRVEWTQLFRDGNATRWSCLLAPDPGAPGGFCMRAGQWRDAKFDSAETGAYMGSFTATAGPRGRASLHVDEHWGEDATEEMLALRDELSAFRDYHHSGDRFAEELINRRGETARVARQRELWDLATSSDSSDEDAGAVSRSAVDCRSIDNGRGAYSGANSRRTSQSQQLATTPRSPEARILRRVGRGWERGDVEKVTDNDGMRQLEMRDVKAVARQCFELFAQDDEEHPAGITSNSYIGVEAGVHKRLGLPFAPADAAAEYAEEIVTSGHSNRKHKGTAAGWSEYWRFIRTQMDQNSQDIPEMHSYLVAVLDELRAGSVPR